MEEKGKSNGETIKFRSNREEFDDVLHSWRYKWRSVEEDISLYLRISYYKDLCRN